MRWKYWGQYLCLHREQPLVLILLCAIFLFSVSLPLSLLDLPGVEHRSGRQQGSSARQGNGRAGASAGREGEERGSTQPHPHLSCFLSSPAHVSPARLPQVSSIGAGDSKAAVPGKEMDVLGPVLVEKEKSEERLKASEKLKWTIVRPGGLLSDVRGEEMGAGLCRAVQGCAGRCRAVQPALTCEPALRSDV
ncbi:unnamed protein product [Closterium sp. NIES-53]